MKLLNRLLKNNKKWAKEKRDRQPGFFKELSSGQNPEVLFIGCSDSRLNIEKMTNVRLGQIFVHRNIANLVLPNDLNALSVIQYAVDSLKVKHIIVCGHYFCGGIQAAFDDVAVGPLDIWLQEVRNIYQEHKSEIDEINEKQEKLNKLVELNVKKQCHNLRNLEIIKKARKKKHAPIIHPWVVDLKSGLIIDLNDR